MTGIFGIKRCGNCHFGKIIPNDLSKRICWGAPPTVIAVGMVGPGQIKTQMVRPVVEVHEEACALYRGRDQVDIDADEQIFKEEPISTETKQ